MSDQDQTTSTDKKQTDAAELSSRRFQSNPAEVAIAQKTAEAREKERQKMAQHKKHVQSQTSHMKSQQSVHQHDYSEHDVGTEAPFYSAWQTGLCGYFFGPMALSYYIQQNYLVLNQEQSAKEVRVLGIVLSVVLAILAAAVKSTMLQLLVSLVPAIVGGWLIVYKKQLEPLGMKKLVIQHGYQTTGKAIVQGLINLVWFVLIVFAVGIVVTILGG